MDAGGEGLEGGEDGGLVEGEELAVAHEPTAVYHDGTDVLRVGGVDDGGIGVVKGEDVAGVGVQENEVGPFADFKAADEMVEAKGTGTVDGGQAKSGTGVDGLGVAGDALGEEGGEAHFLQHVERVVAGDTIGAESDVDACTEVRRGVGYAATQLEVALGTVGSGGAGTGDELLFRGVEPDAMGKDGAGVEKAHGIKIIGRATVLAGKNGVYLGEGLGKMNVEGSSVRLGELLGPQEGGAGTGVGRVGTNGRGDEGIALPLLKKTLGPQEPLVDGAETGRGKIDNRLAHHGPKARPLGLGGDDFLEEIHVVKASGP